MEVISRARKARWPPGRQVAGTPRTLVCWIRRTGDVLAQAEASLAGRKARTDRQPPDSSPAQPDRSLRVRRRARGRSGGTSNPAYASLPAMRVGGRPSSSIQSRLRR